MLGGLTAQQGQIAPVRLAQQPLVMQAARRSDQGRVGVLVYLDAFLRVGHVEKQKGVDFSDQFRAHEHNVSSSIVLLGAQRCLDLVYARSEQTRSGNIGNDELTGEYENPRKTAGTV